MWHTYTRWSNHIKSNKFMIRTPFHCAKWLTLLYDNFVIENFKTSNNAYFTIQVREMEHLISTAKGKEMLSLKAMQWHVPGAVILILTGTKHHLIDRHFGNLVLSSLIETSKSSRLNSHSNMTKIRQFTRFLRVSNLGERFMFHKKSPRQMITSFLLRLVSWSSSFASAVMLLLHRHLYSLLSSAWVNKIASI